ncbi:MAG: DUF2493 domain-containing protein [Clostridia bacterium]|nr:DUF2493 domain-containing protein [Clostridia bacterium]
MKKRIVVAGCRDYDNYYEAEEYIDSCISDMKSVCEFLFISGGCRGADALGERYAREHGYEIERYPAEWEKYGRAAGPMRNRKMAEIADFIICFWDGKSRGTKAIIDFATALNRPVRIKRIPLS